ncbi:MAG: transcriptional regulator [Bradyrhizobium sp.]|uniref:ATP-binding protein n=1 Tax=Bradyrhizobium sp. TaxID=376 RepID=UPI001C281A31|nr:ATP-binding protein [Bradyrhizobium sp.]MBU6463434.1 transcriptional regulator [Pseudomonadota bacterium]MDE2067078.1 transcriptional regulator [Bradyrhizobium sp.]MDE2467302.1 transcriptional regulator [Bradyrhizobium sp.]
MKISDALELLRHLCALPRETEWLEFKLNKFDPEDVARYVSGLSNAAILKGERRAYLAFGVQDVTQEIVGTGIRLKAEKVGNEIFENWLVRALEPHLNLEFISIDCGDGKNVELIAIDPAYQHPVRFKKEAFIRIDSALKSLSSYPEHERALWLATSSFAFEQGIAMHHVTPAEIFSFLDPMAFLEMVGIIGVTRAVAITHLARFDLLIDDRQGRYDITNLLALLAAKKLASFPSVANKSPRVIEYKRAKKIDAVGDVTGQLGYAIGFKKLLNHVMTRMPHEEVMITGVRQNKFPIPEIAARELIANALIHQDFTKPGHPTIEVFKDRVQITNPGSPLIDTRRFIDAPSKSRNEKLAAMMRRIGLCEERGSGVDRALEAIEQETLPAPAFSDIEGSTVAVIYGRQSFAAMSKEARIRACYQHACLRHETNAPMSNASFRKRLGMPDSQYPQASSVIRDAIEGGWIRPLNEDQPNRNARYVPFYV